MKARIVYDASDYVHSSIRDVIEPLLVEALLIVTVVIFLFLGSVSLSDYSML